MAIPVGLNINAGDKPKEPKKQNAASSVPEQDLSSQLLPSFNDNSYSALPQSEIVSSNTTFQSNANYGGFEGNNSYLDESSFDDNNVFEYPQSNTLQYDSSTLGSTNDNDTLHEQYIPARAVKKQPALDEPKAKRGLFKKDKHRSKDSENDFIDEEKLLLKAFGGRKQKPSEFDKRENRNKNARIVRIGVFTILALILGLGVKQAIIPPQTFTQDEIRQMVSTEINDSGFPSNRGEALAKDFLITFLTNNQTSSIGDTADFKKIFTGDSESNNKTVKFSFAQSILYGPTLVNKKIFGENSAQFTFSVVSVKGDVNKFPKDKTGVPNVPENKLIKADYAINVYYDKNTDAIGIQADSPTLLPFTVIKPSKDIPDGINLSTDGKASPDDEIMKEIGSTVQQFMKEYYLATADNHTALDQYLTSSANAFIKKGLGGQFVINNPEIDVTVVGAWKVQGVVKAIVKATGTTAVDNKKENDPSMSVTSTYALTLRKQSGKYLVERITALGYVPAAKDVQ